MIKILNANKQTLHLVAQVKDYYTENELATAEKLIHFLMPKSDPAYVDLKQENYIETPTDRFTIKEINYDTPDFVEVFGKLDTDALRKNMVFNHESVEKSLQVVLPALLVGSGWTAQFNDLPNKLRTIRAEDKTVYEIILQAMNIYDYEVVFDTLNYQVKIYQTVGSDRGSYVYSDLNLKKITYQSDTYDFATRLYAYGKEGLSFASINGGKEYVENTTFHTKIIETIWRDERYTVKENLLADAQARLVKLANPRFNYTVEVLELVKANPIYNILDYKIGDTVKIIEKNDGLVDSQRIIKITEYPITPEKNKIELAYDKIVFQSDVEKVLELTNQEIVRMRTDLMIEIDRVSALIGGPDKGYIIFRTDAEDNVYEQLIMDTPNIETATKVWRWNTYGLGYSSNGYNGSYEVAITQDGSINANFITTGHLNARLITTGLLKSKDASTWIDMDTGDFNLKNKLKFENGEFIVDLSAEDVNINVDELKSFTVILSNDNQSFPVNSEGVSEGVTIKSLITVYKGIEKVSAVVGTPVFKNASGMNIQVSGTSIDVENVETFKQGSVTWTIPSGINLSVDSGWIEIPINIDGTIITKHLNWNKVKAPKNGADGIDGADGTKGEDARLVNIIPSDSYFTANLVGVSHVLTPDIITLEPKFQNTEFKGISQGGWQYSVNGVNWINITRNTSSTQLPFIDNYNFTLSIPKNWNILTQNSNVKFRVHSTTGEMDLQTITILYDVNELESRLNSTELKVTDTAIVGTVVSSSQFTNISDTANTAASDAATAKTEASLAKQTADAVTLDFTELTSFSNGKQLQGGRTTINKDGVKVTHTSTAGQYSQISADGFIRKWNYGTSHYLSDIWTGEFIGAASDNYVEVSLPERFRLRNPEIMILPIDMFPAPKPTQSSGSTDLIEFRFEISETNMNPAYLEPPYIRVYAWTYTQSGYPAQKNWKGIKFRIIVIDQ